MPITLQVIRAYVPSISTKLPAYGVMVPPTQPAIVVLSDTVPAPVLPFLQEVLERNVRDKYPPTAQSLEQLLERLTHDFLRAQLLSGNLRYDRVSNVWRWLGQTAEP